MTNPIARTWIEAKATEIGFTPANAKIAAAISLAEAPVYSKPGYADADLIGDQQLSDSTWGYSYGLFQIRSLRAQKGTGGFRDELRLPDPEFNIKSAFILWSQAGGFSPWTVYQTGAYKAYLQDLFPPEPGTYRVVAGDTLRKIGTALGISWEEIARINNLHYPYSIYIGQNLLLPFSKYTVQPGDTLSGIARQYGEGVTWQTLAAFNQLSNPDRIYPGQVLRIPRSIGE